MPRFDVHKLVHDFGGPTQLVMLLDLYGFPPPTVKGVEKWIERRKIDSNRLAQFVYIARKQKRPINLHDFIVTEEDNADVA